ncbi:MAG: RNA 2'-phosphotransferase [Deltaproteobacteria bacterium]|nr:RNA 2'-phosphotransferase [Deltaproteobacteria bacterium]MBW2124104.1 RNA 2'-phosphotransferase [Deltaproteobacteria bacterium]
MSKRRQYKVQDLVRLMKYALAHSPDEFGLVPDKQGFVWLKELLQAFHEEPGWSYVREAHINEALLKSDRNLFQMEGKRIRATKRSWQCVLEPLPSVPEKILYTPVRKRAHHHAFDKGLRASADRWIVLSVDREMAYRIGKRKDAQPVILEILARTAQRYGVRFYQFGSLFLAKEIAAEYIGGPIPSKERPRQLSGTSDIKEKHAPDFGAGSFALDVDRDPDPMRRSKGRKPKGWKEKARRLRRKRGR